MVTGTKTIYSLLFSRLLLFVQFQALIALGFGSWHESEKYWMLTAALTNIVSISLLVVLFRQEGLRYFNLFRIDKSKWKKDAIIFSGLAVLSVPLVIVPSFILSTWFWGNTTYYHQVLFQPIPAYIVWLLFIAFPVSICFAELPTYFGFVMPRLGNSLRPKWLAVLVPVFFLAVQHCTLPLVFDVKFTVFRGLMYMPFALMLGIALYKRPSLLPYLTVLHGLLDALAVTMLIMEIKK